MAKITALPVTNAVDGTELLPIVQAGATKRMTLAAFRALIVPFLQDWYKGDKGEPGAADNTYSSRSLLRASSTARATAMLVGDNFANDGRFNYEVGKGPYTDDDGLTTLVPEGDTSGAWVRQSAGGVTYRRAAPGAVIRTSSEWMRDRAPSVTDFGARGGDRDDGDAFYNALLDAQTVEGGVAVGARVIVPYNPKGYRIGRKLIIPAGVHLDLQSQGNRLFKIFDGDWIEVQDGSQISNGNFNANGRPGRGFVFRNDTGGQCLFRVRANTGFVDEVVFWELNGGSRSELISCLLTAGNGKFAVKVEDGFMESARPRKVINIETGGALGIDFGGCNDFTVVGGFCGGIRTTSNSRGYHLAALRIANQKTVVLDGHGATITGGFNPVPTFAPGADNMTWNAYCNSGSPIDQTGNTRNSINVPEKAVAPVLRSDGVALNFTPVSGTYPNGYREGWGVERRVSTYTYRLDINLNLTGGAATPAGMGSGFLYLDLPADAYNWGAEQLARGLRMEFVVGGTTYKKDILARILPLASAGAPGTRAQLLDLDEKPITGGQAPGGVGTPGWILKRLYGAFDFKPA